MISIPKRFGQGLLALAMMVCTLAMPRAMAAEALEAGALHAAVAAERSRPRASQVPRIAFLAQNPAEVRSRIQKHKVPMHFRSFPDAKLFQIFLKDPDDVTIELNFLGEVIDEKEWKGKGSASAVTLDRSAGKRTAVRKQN